MASCGRLLIGLLRRRIGHVHGLSQTTSGMKLSGFLLLLAGWGIVLAALALLTVEAQRAAFVIAGVGVEALGLFLFARSHLVPRRERE